MNKYISDTKNTKTKYTTTMRPHRWEITTHTHWKIKNNKTQNTNKVKYNNRKLH